VSTDRERIAELLEDETRSFRSIGRELGVSDWLVRKIARELDGDPRPMKQRPSRPQEPTEEVSTLTGWLVFGGVIGFIALAIWAGVRWTPPDA
jgi:transposase